MGPTADPKAPRDLRRLATNSALGLLAGLAFCASLPPWGWWPLAFVGASLWYHVIDIRPRQRFIVSWFVGFGWFMPSTLWIWALTPPGYLVGGLIGWCGLVGLVGLSVPRGRLRFLVLPAAVMVFEWFHSLAPFGGVPISMLSFGQARGPLLNAARLGGGILVSGLIVALGIAGYLAIFEKRWRPAAATVVIAAVLVATGSMASLLVRLPSEAHTTRIAAVQGGGPQGTTFSYAEIPRVFQRHLNATRAIKGPVDLVVWPENTVYMIDGTFAESQWGQDLAAEAKRLNAPLLVGVVEDDPTDDTRFMNYMIVVEPDGTLGDRYDKERRVPFGEYVPLRSFFEMFAKDQLPGRDARVGEGSAMMRTGPVDAAVAISWEIFFPRRVREGVRDGGTVVINPTNGASYWLTQVQSQQIATSTYRAIESGRWVIQVSPTGFSAVIDPQGRIHDRAGVSEQRVLISDIPSITGITPAQFFGETLVLIIAASVFLYIAGIKQVRERRHLTDNSGRMEA